MDHWIIDAMVFLGSFLMVYNIWGFVRYTRYVKQKADFGKNSNVLYVPVLFLVMFLLGYLVVGFFGKPDLVIAGILLGGSVFVFIMYRALKQITTIIVDNEEKMSELLAAEKSRQEKSSFLSSISHEMRTPMNAILGLTRMALSHDDLPEKIREELEMIGQSGKHLLGLIDNTLDMQYLESGDYQVRSEYFCLKDMTDQIRAITLQRCKEKGLEFRLEMDRGTEGHYMGDVMLIKQVLLAILDNAIMYTEEGSVKLTVRREKTEGDTCRLRFIVEDTGIGISPEFLPKVFDLFAREDASSKSRYGGSGIGLAVARNKARLMGGDIVASSEKGRGSVFEVTLPLPVCQKEEAVPETEEKQESTESTEEPVSLEGLRILVVDDVEMNTEITSDLLELEGMESECAQNGQIALDMFRASPEFYYDAILMDLRMPVMDGLEATRAIRSLERKDAGRVPIIALTANAFESDREKSREAGMNAHLGKPTDPESLYETLRQQIQLCKKERVVAQ